MPGLFQENLMFPILELIRGEVQRLVMRNKEVAGDPFAGTPAVTLYREHPDDPDRITGALLQYESGYLMDIYLTFGTEDVEELPVEIDSNHPDWDYLMNWILRLVTIKTLNPERVPILTIQIRLHYDSSLRLIGTTVNKVG